MVKTLFSWVSPFSTLLMFSVVSVFSNVLRIKFFFSTGISLLSKNALIFLTIIIAVLTGENGLISQEKEKYNNTHVEEIEEKNGNNVVVVKK